MATATLLAVEKYEGALQARTMWTKRKPSILIDRKWGEDDSQQLGLIHTCR